ncbi:MAG: hypothetical protein KJO28_13855 [Desulfofustis sp.]|nr:hypothetical protein [Desulfofustis sp.]NNK56893.1 hypothetical protein [Desulfofustis sp.]
MFRRLFGLDKPASESSESNRYGIDTDSNYCPECGEEYRAGFDTCADCGVALISGIKKLDEVRQQDTGPSSYSMDISTDDDLIAIHTGKLGYIKSLQHILKSEQVPSLLASENASKG